MKMKRGNNIFELIGIGFKKWWENPMIMMPLLFYFIATIIIGLIFILIFSAVFITAVGPNFTTTLLKELSTESNSTELSPELSAALSQLFTPVNIVYLIIFFVILILVMEFVKAYFYSGATSMAQDIANNKKINMAKIWSSGKKYWLKYFATELLIFIGILLWLIVFSLPSLAWQSSWLLAIPFISMFPLFFVLLFFILAPYLVVLKDLEPWQSLKESMKLVKKNYGAFLGLFILFLIMMAIVGMIPYLGSIITLFVITPAMIIAFVTFILERS